MGSSNDRDLSLDEIVSEVVRTADAFSIPGQDTLDDLDLEDLEDLADEVVISVVPRGSDQGVGMSIGDQLKGSVAETIGSLDARNATAERGDGRVRIRVPKLKDGPSGAGNAANAPAPKKPARRAAGGSSPGPKPKRAAEQPAGDARDVRSGAAEASVNAPPARHLRARMPEVIRPRERTLIALFVSQIAADEMSAELEPFVIPPGGLLVKLSMFAPGFLIHDGASRDLLIPEEGDSGQVVFEVEATREGELEISVSAFANGVFLGALSFTVFVRSGESASDSVERIAGIDFRLPEQGEATLEINYDRLSQTYRYQFRGAEFGNFDEMATDPLGRTPDMAVEELIDLLNINARGESGLSSSAARKLLQGKGIELWDELIPTSLQDVFWQSRDSITRLNIISKDDVVPWELLYPLPPGRKDAGGFLAEMFPVARWRYGASPRPRLNLSNPAYVLPAGSPSEAKTEVKVLQRRLGEGSISTTLDDLLERLDKADFGLIHFACHNRFDGRDAAGPYITFGEAQFQPAFLARHRDSFNDRSPVVFMNACRTGAMRMNYTRMNGWASYFLTAGAGAFIGSLWEVRDGSARAFSEAFYDAFRGDTTLGDALQTARAAASEDPADPTRLAYTVYGDLGAVSVQEVGNA